MDSKNLRVVFSVVEKIAVEVVPRLFVISEHFQSMCGCVFLSFNDFSPLKDATGEM